MTHPIPDLLSRDGVCARNLREKFRESCGAVVRKNERKVALLRNESLPNAKIYSAVRLLYASCASYYVVYIPFLPCFLGAAPESRIGPPGRRRWGPVLHVHVHVT